MNQLRGGMIVKNLDIEQKQHHNTLHFTSATTPNLAYASLPFLIKLLSKKYDEETVPISEVQEYDDRVEIGGAAHDFEVMATLEKHVGSCEYYKVQMNVKYNGLTAIERGIKIQLDLIGKGTPTWMIPGAFYKENRFAHNTRMYPRYDFEGGEGDPMASDYWSFRSDRAALPAVFAWNEDMSAALCTDEMSDIGLTGLGFSGNKEGTSVWLNFPYREEPITFHSPVDPQPADCQFHRFEPGEKRQLEFKLYVGTADLHDYDPFIREMYRQYQDIHALNPWIEVEEAAELTAHGLYTWHYNPRHHILNETAAFDREFNGNVKGQGDRPHMHVAWVSGAPYAFSLLTYGRQHDIEHYSEAAVNVLNKIASGVSPSGIFWAEWTEERGWGSGWNPHRDWLQARTISEATLFMIRALDIEKKQGVHHPDWEDAVLSNLSFAMTCQRQDGNFGSYYHCDTGAVEEWDGAGGMLWIAALLEGSSYFGRTDFREAAQKAGHYYQSFIHNEFIYGAPEDVHLTPTSEDAYNALVAYILLYEADQNSTWLDLAKKAADWMMTFRWTYNIEFPQHTMLKQLDFRSRGADQASPSNQHLHNYGLFCFPELMRLWRYTGDRYYLDRNRDHLACFLQCVAREGGDFNAYKGMVTERFYNTNCFQPKGMMLTLSHAWCVGLVLYASQAAAEYLEELDLQDSEKRVLD
ncbi:hypothetical protein JOD43_000058 [Pullulanibacillus pueri]|nr:hypothetical protein [Pullulanibacillus pueri]